MGALCRYRVIESKELASVLMQMLEAASKQAKGGWLDLILDSTLNCLLISVSLSLEKNLVIFLNEFLNFSCIE